MNSPLVILPVMLDDEDKTSIIKNRIRKNYRHMRKWGKRTFTDCFRIYDKDIKQYPLAIDFYAGRFCVQFFSSDREHDDPSPGLKDEVDKTLCSMFGSSLDDIYWRTRIKRKKSEQYEKLDKQKNYFTVYEYGTKFKINLNDYLDTGLFLDHRETRRLVSSMSRDKSVLNLFAYTCSFSVLAAAHGSIFTKSVDMSNTYTKWGEDNFRLNSISLDNNEVVRADCMKFLVEEILSKEKYDIIVIDPPTISRSKKMSNMFDVQIDHPTLIKKALKLLLPGGTIFFSTNSRRFKLDMSLSSLCSMREITDKTIPMDFHNKKIHKCWKITAI